MLMSNQFLTLWIYVIIIARTPGQLVSESATRRARVRQSTMARARACLPRLAKHSKASINRIASQTRIAVGVNQ